MIAILAALTAQLISSTPTETLFCSSERPASDRYAYVSHSRIEVDRTHRPIAYTLFLRGENAPGWNIMAQVFPRGSGFELVSLDLKTDIWGLPDATTFPVRVDLVVKGKVTAFDARSDAGFFGPDAHDPKGYVTTAVNGRYPLRHGVAFKQGLPASAYPNGKRVSLRTIDARKLQVDERRLQLPKWRDLKRYVNTTFKALDEQRREKKCVPAYIVDVS